MLSTMWNFFSLLNMCDAMNATTHDPHMDSSVLTMARSCAFDTHRAPLNEGQNIHRNRVPIIANTSLKKAKTQPRTEKKETTRDTNGKRGKQY